MLKNALLVKAIYLLAALSDFNLGIIVRNLIKVFTLATSFISMSIFFKSIKISHTIPDVNLIKCLMIYKYLENWGFLLHIDRFQKMIIVKTRLWRIHQSYGLSPHKIYFQPVQYSTTVLFKISLMNIMVYFYIKSTKNSLNRT